MTAVVTFGPDAHLLSPRILRCMNNEQHLALRPEQCRSLLQQGRVGRVAFTNRALPSVVPVRYRISGDRLLLDAVTGPEWPGRVAGSVVAFEVDRFRADHQVDWSVVVIGTAERELDGGVSLDLRVSLLTGESRTVTAPG